MKARWRRLRSTVIWLVVLGVIGGASADGKFAGLYTNNIAGIHADFTRGLVLRDTGVVWGANEDFYGAALESGHAEGLKLENFSGVSAQPGIIPDKVLK